MNLKKINTFLFTINKFIVLDPYCPVFLVNYVLTKAEPDREDRYKMLINVSLFKQNFTRKPFFLIFTALTASIDPREFERYLANDPKFQYRDRIKTW